MFGSMFIGLSGMNAYSAGLRQVSNNITNLNSAGYRASTLSFGDLFSGGTQGVSYMDTNGRSGYGVNLSDLRLDFSQGELRQSDRDLDLAVSGNGFLVLENDGEYAYARTGQFEIDADGYIVLAGTEYRLTVMDDQGRAQSLSIDNYRTSRPNATTRVEFSDNLSSTATELTIPDVRVFSADGVESTWSVAFTREETVADEWTLVVTDQDGNEVGREIMKFNTGTIDPSTTEFTFVQADEGISVTFDFSEGVTSFSSGSISTLRTSDIDGFGMGELTSLRVNEDGRLEVSYSNEQTDDLGAISLADFRDPQGLEQSSGGLFFYDSSQGVDFLTADSDRVGTVLSGRLENSNVDLSKEFGDLILVQRGYQASSQIVSISNDMIQQLFGITGRG